MDNKILVKENNNYVLEQRGSIAAKVIWLVIAVFFLFPLFTVSYATLDVYKVTGFVATFGLNRFGQTVFRGRMLFGILFLIPIIVLIANFFVKNLYDVMVWNLVGSIAEAFMLLIYMIGLPQAYKDTYITIDFSAVFYIEFLLSVVLIVLSIYLLYNMAGKKKVDTVEDMCRKGGIFIVLYCISIVVIIWLVVNFRTVGQAFLNVFF